MKIITSIFSLLLAISINAQDNLELTFSKYKNNDKVSYMSFGSNIMDFAKNSEKEWKTTVDRVDIILFPKDMDFNPTEKQKLDTALDEDNFEVLLNAKSKGQQAAIYGLGQGEDVLKILYANVYTDEANIYFLLKGDIHFEELSEIGLNFQGADVFKNIGK